MTWIVRDTDSGNERECESRSEAEEVMADMEQLGLDCEIIGPDDHATDGGPETDEHGQLESSEGYPGTSADGGNAEVVETVEAAVEQAVETVKDDTWGELLVNERPAVSEKTVREVLEAGIHGDGVDVSSVGIDVEKIEEYGVTIPNAE